MEHVPPATPPESTTHPLNKLSRRDLFMGAAAWLAVPGQAEANAPSTSLRPPPRPGNEAIEVMKDAAYAHYEPFHEQVLAYTDTLERDVEVVLSRAEELVTTYPSYSNFFQFLRSELPLDDIPEPTKTAVRDIMVCVPYVESRLDNRAVSSVGAFGVLQLMPATWEEHAQPQDDPHDILAQVRVAGALVSQTYRFLTQRHHETFSAITDILYDGDEERCAREFVGSLVGVSYFSGMGTVSRVIDRFAHDYVTHEDRQRMDAMGITTDTLGTYSLLTTASQFHKYDRNFGPEGVAYIPKTLATRAVLELSLPPQILNEIL